MAYLANGGTAEYGKQKWNHFHKLITVNTSESEMNQAQEYGITQYNQGFYKFGPMEQCATGEWVRWKEVEPFLRAADLRVETAMETEQEILEKAEYLTASMESWRENYFEERGASLELQKSRGTWRAIAIGLVVALIVAVVIIAAGGFHA